MANIYLRSGATGAANGTSMADAYTTIAALITGGIAATDTIYVASDHAESTAGTVTMTFPLTIGCKMLCINATTGTPTIADTALATTASIAIGASSSTMSIRGYVYVHGVSFLGATNSSSTSLILIGDPTVQNVCVFNSCSFEIRNANSGAYIALGQVGSTSNDNVYVGMNNCSFKFGGTSQSVQLRNARIEMSNISINSSGSTPTSLFLTYQAVGSSFELHDSDLSGVNFTNLFTYQAAGNSSCHDIKVYNCKLPGSMALTTGTRPGLGGPIIKMHNCDSADTNYRIAEEDFAGNTVSETTIVMSGGASDGTTPISYKMTTTSAAAYPTVEYKSSWIASAWNDTTGSSKTATVEIVHDSQGSGTSSAFLDDEIWLEISYLGTSGSPRGTLGSDEKASLDTTAADQASSSETWTTTGLTTPVKQKLSVTFTPQEKGVIIGRICMAKASSTVYINPVITIT